MNPNESPKPVWIDLSTCAGAIPAASPSAMLEISNARNACSLAARIRKSSSAIEATVTATKYVPFVGIGAHSNPIAARRALDCAY